MISAATAVMVSPGWLWLAVVPAVDWLAFPDASSLSTWPTPATDVEAPAVLPIGVPDFIACSWAVSRSSSICRAAASAASCCDEDDDVECVDDDGGGAVEMGDDDGTAAVVVEEVDGSAGTADVALGRRCCWCCSTDGVAAADAAVVGSWSLTTVACTTCGDGESGSTVAAGGGSVLAAVVVAASGTVSTAAFGTRTARSVAAPALPPGSTFVVTAMAAEAGPADAEGAGTASFAASFIAADDAAGGTTAVSAAAAPAAPPVGAIIAIARTGDDTYTVACSGCRRAWAWDASLLDDACADCSGGG